MVKKCWSVKSSVVQGAPIMATANGGRHCETQGRVAPLKTYGN